MGKAELRRRAQIAIIAAYNEYRRRGTARWAAAALTADYNAGRLPALAEHRKIVPKVSESSIFSWLKTLRQGGEDALGDRRRGTRRSIWQMHPAMRQYAEQLFNAYPAISGGELWEALWAIRFEQEWRVPGERTVSRLLERLRSASGRLGRASLTSYQWVGRGHFKRPEFALALIVSGSIEHAYRQSVMTNWPARPGSAERPSTGR